MIYEVLRQSDINRGGTFTDDPPLWGASFDVDEKRWTIDVPGIESLPLFILDRCHFPVEVSDGMILIKDEEEA